MITPENFAEALRVMGFAKNGNSYEKEFPAFGASLKADVKAQKLFYPETIKGRERNGYYDEAHKENLVVFECVNRLLEKGYRPEHIELEKEWHLGHDAKSGRADICVTNADGKMLCIVECKTAGREYQKALSNMKNDGGQLFSYWQQERGCAWLLLYASDFADGSIVCTTESVDCHDDNNILLSAKKNDTVKLYKNAHTAEELFAVWDETYDKRLSGDVVFRDDTVAYQIGLKPLRKKDLADFKDKESVVNDFEEILRHNNVSDKENAFNRLVALFICKLVDEIEKKEEDVVEFQYKVGTDTYESLQDRLQRLHKDGMEKFMNEKIFYVEEDYADTLVKQYTGQNRRKMIAELKQTLRILKFYTNNDFAFKDVHNEELFYQNGKILVEVVQLFEPYRIIGAGDLQTLGDLFEQLLNKGFKQNEGQFFTPVPICRFIWDSLPLDALIFRANCQAKRENEAKIPKIVDYACGAGHFLSEGFVAVNACLARHKVENPSATWADSKLYGIEKDYRLARVSKIALFMHGVDKEVGNIIFGDGLENYRDKGVVPNAFDILVANPPYAVSAFKQHLKLRDNDFAILSKISNDGSEIETLFVERIAQLVRPGGVAAVILPSSILNKENGSFIGARESLLTNFYLRAVAQFGSKTFGATGTNTIVVFLQKFDEPPKRIDLVTDSVDAIQENRTLTDWEDKEIFEGYLAKIGVAEADYRAFLSHGRNYDGWEDVPYFAAYASAFLASNEYTAKAKQRSFLQASEDERRAWANAHFYEFAGKRESEKLTFFGLCYRQTTLIITAPDDNKGQEEFLGYTWSNRKGQEGIQVKTEGGMMYRPDDRTATDTLAALVRKSYAETEADVPALSAYYHYLPLVDMLDFSGVEFNKAIKTTKISDVSIQLNRAFNTELLEKIVDINTKTFDPNTTPNEQYHYVDIGSIENHKLNYSTVIMGSNAPSRARRIANENDVIISTVRPNLKGFAIVKDMPQNTLFSTGFAVLSSKDQHIILNEFLFISFMYDSILMEQMRSKMGKGSYPSINQNDIKNFYLLLPSLAMQKKIIKEFHALDKQIEEQDTTVQKCDEEIKAKFVEMFGNIQPPVDNIPLHEVCQIIRGVTYDKKNEVKNSSNNAILTADNITLDGQFELKKVIYIDDNIILDNQKHLQKNDIFICLSSGSISHVGKTAYISSDIDFYAGGFMGILRMKDSSRMLSLFLFHALQTQDAKSYFRENATGTNIKNLSSTIGNMLIMCPNTSLQNQFAAFVEERDKTKQKAQKRKEALLLQREQAIEKYFR